MRSAGEASKQPCWEELSAILRAAIRSGRAIGLEVTIYNPKLDSDGSAGRGLAQTVGAALAAKTFIR
jgi:arginase